MEGLIINISYSTGTDFERNIVKGLNPYYQYSTGTKCIIWPLIYDVLKENKILDLNHLEPRFVKIYNKKNIMDNNKR